MYEYSNPYGAWSTFYRDVQITRRRMTTEVVYQSTPSGILRAIVQREIKPNRAKDRNDRSAKQREIERETTL